MAKYREVSFVATCDEHSTLQCYQVPFSDTKSSYEWIVEHVNGYDCFVQREDPLVKVLSVLTKFEDEKFLHPLKSPEDTLKIDLPRFKLLFVLDDDMQLASLIFGRVVHVSRVVPTQELVSLAPLPVPENNVKSAEEGLGGVVRSTRREGDDISPLPLRRGTTDTMGKAMLGELEFS
ncbi:hypothetical protein JG688_00002683 [Phytophthora aleatoria]|uniref:Uncharacterized protein n=1 Tax=Phytophthora aleatoria TaxID=2496075 RepID=A0A8J5M8J9_9STRA|nr:hypothetical protein JG688_00002683 [Phytophthora aleatoria]